jgi:ABC-type sugar transport system ATPase subunit
VAGETATVSTVDHRDRSAAPVVLAVRNMALTHVLDDVSFDLHEGEVLGIAGFLGSGRTELLESIFGLRHDATGEVWVSGAKVTRRSPRNMLDRRVAMISEDRKAAGIVPLLGVGENTMLSARGRLLPKFWIRARREARLEAGILSKLSIRASSPDQEIGTLSGGNQQKGVIGRALAADMRVLLLDEPTRGVDLHAKTQIYTLIRGLAADGVASIFVSSELEELTQVCDRVIVLRSGRNRDELVGAAATPDRILSSVMKEED